MPRIAFLLLPGVHLLDLAGPAQVFSTADQLELAGYDLRYLAEQETVPSAQGLPVRAEVEWPELTTDDLLIVPGWRIAAADRRPGRPSGGPVIGERVLAAVRAHHTAGGTVASVCAGAFALASAGLLDGRRCTTHHELQDLLAAGHPGACVVRDVLYVVDGRVVTSAGIASGIDLALSLVAGRHGPAAAARVARSMVVYARRNGQESQDSLMLRHRGHVSDVVHRVQDVIDARFDQSLPLADLACAAGVSERTLTRAFDRVLGITPLRYQQLLRLERAEHLIGQGAPVETAARASGFEDARMLRRLRARRGPGDQHGPGDQRGPGDQGGPG